MTLRNTLPALAAVATCVAILHSSPVLNLAAVADEHVIVVITLREQPSPRVLSDLRSGAAPESPRQRDAEDARLQRAALERIAGIVKPAQQRVAAAVEARGGTVLYRLRGYGALVARVPRRIWKELQRLPDARAVELESQYRRTQVGDIPPLIDNAHAALTASRGRGTGTVDIAVVDTGLHTSHPVFLSHASSVLSQIFHNSARLQADYADDHTDPDDRQGHGTMVTGVLFAPDEDGASPARPLTLDHLYNLKAAYNARDGASHATQGDVMTAIDASLGFADPPEVINYSYGSDAAVDDDGYCRFFDNVVDTFGKTLTLSAGNAGLRAIGTPGIAYNVISVANVNGRGTADRADDVIAATSSAGPTPGGRRKPDLAALGSQVQTVTRTGALERVTGTSFAAPSIAAAAARLIDAGTTDPRAVKAVMLNSADDFGPAGWDIDFGWGYFNEARTQRHARDVVLAHVAPQEANRRYFVRSGAAPVKATLVWNRHVSDDTSHLSDLDLLLYDQHDGRLRDASISSIDNVEQVVSAEDVSAVLVVEHADHDIGEDETFALAHSGGFEERGGPGVAVRTSTTRHRDDPRLIVVEAVVSNPGDLRGHGYDVQIVLPRHARLVTGQATRSLGALSAGEQVSTTWTIHVDPALDDPITVTATTQAYGSARGFSTEVLHKGSARRF